jgi:ribonuclease HII
VAPRKKPEAGPRPAPWNKPFVLGIDENGMGPRLGPLIVTAVLVETDEPGRALATSRPRGAIAKRIGDSKALVAFDDSALGEAWARAIALRAGHAPKTPAELLALLALDTESDLRAPCPSHHDDLCWGTEGETFSADEAAVRDCGRDLEKLEARGVRVLGAQSAILCTRRLNDGAARGLSRFDMDLHAMERLTIAARDRVGAEVYALCGKVGGFDFYGPRFGPLGGYLHTMLVEGRARSDYLVPGVGRLAFVRDADDSHLVVGLASLIGKWVRDHLMRRVVRWHRAHHPDLPNASGYHDPVTTRFVEATALLRKAKRLEDACFERVSLTSRAGAIAGRALLDAPGPISLAPSPKKPGRPKGGASPSPSPTEPLLASSRSRRRSRPQPPPKPPAAPSKAGA